MTDRATLLAEAYRRGLLPPAQKSAYEEAQRRGIVSAPEGQKPMKGAMGEVLGGAMNLYRSIPLVDEGAAALDSGLRLATGQAHSLPEAWKQSRDLQNTNADDFQRRRPTTTAVIKGTGNSLSMAVPAGRAAQVYANGGRAMNALRGATTAAGTAYGYGVTDQGALAERGRAGASAATNPLVLGLGALGGALATPRAPAAAPRNAAERLVQEGVRLTPGQRFSQVPGVGGVIKNAEDLAQRAPLVGPAIRGARRRGVESLQQVAANRALAPIGETLPGNVRAGHHTTDHVATRLGAAYDAAADMVPAVARDPAFDTRLAEISQRVRELPTDTGNQFAAILDNRVNSRFGAEPITGRELRRIQSEVGNLAAHHGSSPDPAQQALGDMLDEVSEELANSLGRANPEAGALIGRANEGYSNYVRLRNAGSRAKGTGVPSLAQLEQAVRMSDRSVGKGNVARGNAVMQDLTRDAGEAMPDAFGNPGTADAVGLGALATSVVTAPHVGIPTAGGLGAAAVPYMMMGRGPIAPRAAAPDLTPEERALRALVAARLGLGAGAAGGAYAPQGLFGGSSPLSSRR